MDVCKIGIIGCGNISTKYLKSAAVFESIECVAVADLDMSRAQSQAKEYGVPKACTVEELLAMDEIEIVVNLTTPQAHLPVSLSIIAAGKHVYTEKPLAVDRAKGKQILDAAEAAGVRVGCAPGTCLGAGLQTCRKLIDEGVIGEPVAAFAFLMNHGHEHWHPDPQYYYKPGAGPMLDMGPYYLTALTTLIGPVTRIAGTAGIQVPERTITSQPHYGEKITVETPDHVTGTMNFANGAIGTIVTTFAAWNSTLPRIEIHGTEGTISVPDPNTLDGPVRVAIGRTTDWEDVPLSHLHTNGQTMWGIGVAEMAHAIRADRAHRVTGKHGYHVLDLMQGFLETSQSGQYYDVSSTFDRPAPLPVSEREGWLD